ncbi:MAG: VanZ family protein [Lachnospiraceae bacterium]|nr:VanZ family protein [Lachnospiraceae bacterium]
MYFSAILPILIECSQLFIARQVDVDDCILNFCGALAGGLLYVVLAGIFPKLRTAAL